MELRVVITDKELPLPSDRTLAEAGAAGMMDLIYRHLIQRNATSRRRAGMPKSDYWADAADSMQVNMEGSKGVVTIDKEGAALHYYGGVVYPSAGKKALAIPVHPEVWDQRPAGFDPGREKLSLVWPKGEKTGTLREKKTGEPYYILVAHATIPADRSVLPTEDALMDAARSAMEGVL